MGLWFTELQNRISSSGLSNEPICFILQSKSVPIGRNRTETWEEINADVRLDLFNRMTLCMKTIRIS